MVCGGSGGRESLALGVRASSRLEGAPGPAHGDGKGVRRLGTSGVMENRGTDDFGGLPEQTTGR
jgi:hypothetical protein